MERTVMELEAGNYEADDSDVKQRYDNQRQLNVQLQEQKRWLEHELEQVGCGEAKSQIFGLFVHPTTLLILPFLS